MRILSGIQSSGQPHIGNYFGAIRQWIELQHQGESLYFIANYHALTTVRDAAKMRELTHGAALDLLALGLDPAKAIVFRQSDIPEVTELFWILSSVSPMGLLERGHSFKDKTARGIAADLGLFSYPVLMAADILLYGSDVVPVGKDQVQHLEMTRDIATKFNAAFVAKYDPADPEGKKKGNAPGILKLPEARVLESTAVVPGLDGQKMSKSYGNALEVFADDATVKKKIMGIKSDSTPVEAPKDPDASPIFALMKLFASAEELASIEASFRQGGQGYGHYKARLLEMFHEHFDAARARRKELESDRAYVEKVLEDGARRAREHAAPVMKAVREAVGLR
ncbi:MAG: tryptophan--tRNA ligase [Polyangiaceae bacterium]